MNSELQARPICRCNSAERVGLQRGGIGAMKHLDAGSFERREVGEKRRAIAQPMTAQKGREMASAIEDRRLGRRIFEQIAGDQVMKVVITEDPQRGGEVLLEDVEEAVEIHVRVDIEASLSRQ